LSLITNKKFGSLVSEVKAECVKPIREFREHRDLLKVGSTSTVNDGVQPVRGADWARNTPAISCNRLWHFYRMRHTLAVVSLQFILSHCHKVTVCNVSVCNVSGRAVMGLSGPETRTYKFVRDCSSSLAHGRDLGMKS